MGSGAGTTVGTEVTTVRLSTGVGMSASPIGTGLAETSEARVSVRATVKEMKRILVDFLKPVGR